MPEPKNPLPESGWMSDKIVSAAQEADFAAISNRSGVRLDGTGPYLRLHFANVYVRDQERSIRFFVDQLGFTLIADVTFASGNRWVEVAPPDGTAVLALVIPRTDWNEERFIGNSGLVTFLTEDVEGKYREWSERGVHFPIPPQSPSWGGTFCRFEDVDGNAFALAGFDDVTRQIDARRQALAEQMEIEQRAAQELEIAKQVQARLFPQRLPAISALDYAGVCVQARSVGGDYYDFLDLGPDRVALVIGDIAGKGMAAALLMANLQANLRSQCVSAMDHLEEFLGSVNRLLFQNTATSSYATLFFAEYDHRLERVRYANCGHLSGLILRRNGTLERLEPTCTVVGLFEDWKCCVSESRLDEGDLLALYTDGVTESSDSSDEEFGEVRLIEELRSHRGLPSAELANTIVQKVLHFSAPDQFDDITLIIAKRVAAQR
ncbi:SpoIIE family protein phosphatase [Tunturibacter psychrotolerans]|uniref:SpoIIE family protein phosphatase n=1 Tax=Tunturiibacter psychrotolerans TaxID=3069686 RepID=A0AAU7ZN91_9BACT